MRMNRLERRLMAMLLSIVMVTGNIPSSTAASYVFAEEGDTASGQSDHHDTEEVKDSAEDAQDPEGGSRTTR